MQLNWNCILFAPLFFLGKLSGRVYDAARSFGWIDGLRAGDGPSLTPKRNTNSDGSKRPQTGSNTSL